MTGVNHTLARAARLVINAREQVADPPEVDAHAWRSIVSEARALDHQGDDARAAALIDAWLASEFGRLGLEPPEETA